MATTITARFGVVFTRNWYKTTTSCSALLRNQTPYSTMQSAKQGTNRQDTTRRDPTRRDSPREDTVQGRAEMAYAARKATYDTLIKKEAEEYERGKRHLANMMGEDPENFSQADIDRAIKYLLPSGLFDKRARPIMKHPSEIFPPQKETQVDSEGRPFHYLFYTGKPNFFNLMHNAYAKLVEIQGIEDKMLAKGIYKPGVEPLILKRSLWLTKEDLVKMVIEDVTDHDYNRLIRLLERIIQQPYAKHIEEYILTFRKDIMAAGSKEVIEPLKYDENGVAYSEGKGKRKTAMATVTIRDRGTGKVVINGKELLDYFKNIQDREQLMFPFQFVGKLGDYDVECTVEGGGHSGQAGAIRLAASYALRSFLTEEKIEQMRQAGLLTKDPRTVERQKPGQKGARKKFTWKKR
ncbi:small ribosomal subunit protein uS9m-like [Glandiceps talaboti]